jgi:hypothetical protein
MARQLNLSSEAAMNLALIDTYIMARKAVVAAGYAWEIDAQKNASLDQATEKDFLQEAAWVILSAGMKESVIRKKFTTLSHAFLHWESANAIAKCKRICRATALSCFAHEGKIDAILAVADHVAENGFHYVKQSIQERGTEYLQSFPFIGPVTCWHLAKNLGVDVVKPDRHLSRISAVAGFASPQSLCRAIADLSGERISVIDVVLWRFATLNRQYLMLFKLLLHSHRGPAGRAV